MPAAKEKSLLYKRKNQASHTLTVSVPDWQAPSFEEALAYLIKHDPNGNRRPRWRNVTKSKAVVEAIIAQAKLAGLGADD